MSHPLEFSTIRILKSDGAVVGTGFLVSKQLAVTCAHVVESARVQPSETITIQFTAWNQISSARVIPDWYRDPDHGDIAFLRLEDIPENARPIRLGMAEHSLSGNIFRAFGYPNVGEIEGVHARGEILGMVTENTQRLLQLRSIELNQGHSGASVWDEKRSVVVGMIVSVYKSEANGKLRDTAFAIPSETLWQICPEIFPSEKTPYLGLKNFTDETAEFFFGRDTLTEKLLDVLRKGSRFLAVLGPSGSGKSSVVRAGLLPALRKGRLTSSQKWAQITMRPADNPFEQIKAAGLDPNNIDGFLKSHSDVERVVLFIDQFEELFTLCPDEVRNRFVHNLTTALKNPKLILILSMRDDFYSAFNSKAASLAESEILSLEGVPGILKHDELVAMIERPAEAAGLILEKGLTELILKDLMRDGDVRSSTLPLLEFALTQLWEKRSDGQLTHKAYEDIHGVTGSLAQWADIAYSDLSLDDQVLAESLLTSLVHLGDEVQELPDTRRHRSLDQFDDGTLNVIHYFTDRRLIVTSGRKVELVHDALISEWGRLRGWVEKDRDNLSLLEEVNDAALRWDRNGRDKNLLNHRGMRLELALNLSTKPHYMHSKIEQLYLGACAMESDRIKKRDKQITVGISIGLVVMTLIAIFAGFQWRKAEQQTRVAKARAEELRNLAIVEQANKAIKDHNPDLGLALVMNAAEMENPSSKAYTTLLDSAYVSLSRKIFEVCSQSNLGAAWVTALDISPDDAWAAVGCSVSGKSSINLLDLQTGRVESEWSYPAWIYSLAFSGDGRNILAGYSDSKAILWDLNGFRQYALEAHTAAVSAVAFSPDADSQIMATASHDKTVAIWDARTGQKIRHINGSTLARFPGKLTSLDFSPDGGKIALGDDEGNIFIWNLDERTLISSDNWDQQDKFVLHVAFDFDGSRVFSGSADSTIAVRNYGDSLARSATLDIAKAYPGIWVRNIIFTPDGSKYLTALSNGVVLVWDARSLQVIQHLEGHLNEVENLAVSSDGSFALSGGRDGVVRQWDLKAIDPVSSIDVPTAVNGNSEINSIIFTKDDSLLFGGSASGVINIWNLNDHTLADSWPVFPSGASISELKLSPDEKSILAAGSTGQVSYMAVENHQTIWNFSTPGDNARSVDISADGKRGIIGYLSGKIILLDMETGESVCTLSGHTNSVNTVRFVSEKNAVSGSNDYSVILWDLSTCEKDRVLFRHDGWVMALAISPKGGLIASTSADGTTIVWDLESAQMMNRLRIPEVDINPGLDGMGLSLDFSPDGHLLAAGSANGGLAVWSVANGILLRRFIPNSLSVCVYGEHCYWILSAKFTSSGDSVWASSADGMMRSWPLIQASTMTDLRDWLMQDRYIPILTTQEKEAYGLLDP